VPAVTLRRRSRTTARPSVITLRNRRSLTAPARRAAVMDGEALCTVTGGVPPELDDLGGHGCGRGLLTGARFWGAHLVGAVGFGVIWPCGSGDPPG
jgi:hypothetical protein